MSEIRVQRLKIPGEMNNSKHSLIREDQASDPKDIYQKASPPLPEGSPVLNGRLFLKSRAPSSRGAALQGVAQPVAQEDFERKEKLLEEMLLPYHNKDIKEKLFRDLSRFPLKAIDMAKENGYKIKILRDNQSFLESGFIDTFPRGNLKEIQAWLFSPPGAQSGEEKTLIEKDGSLLDVDEWKGFPPGAKDKSRKIRLFVDKEGNFFQEYEGKVLRRKDYQRVKDWDRESDDRTYGLTRSKKKCIILRESVIPTPQRYTGSYLVGVHEFGHALDYTLRDMDFMQKTFGDYGLKYSYIHANIIEGGYGLLKKSGGSFEGEEFFNEEIETPPQDPGRKEGPRFIRWYATSDPVENFADCVEAYLTPEGAGTPFNLEDEKKYQDRDRKDLEEDDPVMYTYLSRLFGALEEQRIPGIKELSNE